MNASLPSFRCRLLSSAVCLLLVAGCNVIPPPQADSTRYYALASPALDNQVARPTSGTLRLGLKPVDVAPYLKKDLIVLRRGENELVYNEYARWAEPLEASIARALRTCLLADAKTGRVYAAPFPFDQERDFDLAIGIVRCEGVQAGGNTVARFVATLEITSAGTNPAVVVRKTITLPDVAWDGRDYAALVRALSDDVAALGQEIAAALPEKK
ncbi:MAG TPA: PqiC family protein [Opitutaceae bacterium]|nr:PqiC family protein [Opitutaceae bacterium]